MPGWNTDISKAPRGRYVVKANGPNAKGVRKVFERQEIILASPCGAVMVSYFIPEAKRWNMFPAGVQPVAWMPYSGPRQYIDDKGKTRYAIDLPAHPTVPVSWFQRLLAEQKAAA